MGIRKRCVVAGVAAALLLAACGDDDPDEPVAPTTQPPTPAATATSSPLPQGDGSPTPGGTATPGPTGSPTGGLAADPCTGPELESAAFIFVTSPAPGESFASGDTVRGCSNVFEATHEWELLDGDGAVLADGFGTASCGTGCVGTFTFAVDYTVDEQQVGTLRVFASSPRDGSETHVNAIPLVLSP